MAAGGQHADEAAQPTPAGLLELPDNLLHAICGQLSSVADLAAVAASCSALRALVWGSSWDQAAAFAAHVYTPGLPASLRWAAQRMPRVRGSILHAVRFVFGLLAAWQRLASQPPHLPPTLPPALQLRSVDLSGATACCDTDLLPLSNSSHLTSLSLAGLWRVTVRVRLCMFSFASVVPLCISQRAAEPTCSCAGSQRQCRLIKRWGRC